MAERNELSPAEKTAILFSQDVRKLAVFMQGMEIAVLGTDKRIRVEQTLPYLIAENSGMYRRGQDGINIDNLPTGTFWALYWPLRKMRLSLITAKEDGQRGACVRLIRASGYNPRTKLFVPMKREGGIADYLGLTDNETATLKFGAEPNVLYLDRSITVIPEEEETSPMIIDSEAADRYMRELLGE